MAFKSDKQRKAVMAKIKKGDFVRTNFTDSTVYGKVLDIRGDIASVDIRPPPSSQFAGFKMKESYYLQNLEKVPKSHVAKYKGGEWLK